MIAAFALLHERDLSTQPWMIANDVTDLLEATHVRVYDLAHGAPRLSCDGDGILVPPAALEMERALLPRALVAGRSLISNHPNLDADLRPLAIRCHEQHVITQLLLIRAFQETHGAVAVHWIDHERPSWEKRSSFYYYWDNVGLAVALAREHAGLLQKLAYLEERAHTDRLTGLADGLALADELERHHATIPLSVIALDFDGMREANDVFNSYERGGDVLIQAVGRRSPGYPATPSCRRACTPPAMSSQCFSLRRAPTALSDAPAESRLRSTRWTSQPRIAPSITAHRSGTPRAATGRCPTTRSARDHRHGGHKRVRAAQRGSPRRR